MKRHFCKKTGREMEKPRKIAPNHTDFPQKQVATPNWNCDLFFSGLDVYFVHKPTPDSRPSGSKGGAALTVYADMVFVLNFLVNYLLLRGTARLGGSAARKRRLALGALLGAAYAVAVYFPAFGWFRLFPMKLVCAAGMLLIAFGAKRSTFRLAAIFTALTLVLCGAVYGVELLKGGKVRVYENSLLYPVTFASLLLTAAAVSAACRLLLPRLTHSVDSIVPLTLRLRGRTVHLSALRDSGNTLSDPVSGASVLTACWTVAKRLLPPELSLCADDFATPAALALRLRDYSPRLIPYRAVGVSRGLLLALPCEITLEKQTKTGLVAFCPTPLSDSGAYEALTGGILYA